MEKVILLVEDTATDEHLMLRALKKSSIGSSVVVARDGAEALDYILATGKHAGRLPSARPDLVLLDLKLPKLDGLDVLRHVRADARLRRLPVVVLTSSSEESDIAAAYELGANSYVRKPVDFTEFSQVVAVLGQYWLTINEYPPGGGAP